MLADEVFECGISGPTVRAMAKRIEQDLGTGSLSLLASLYFSQQARETSARVDQIHHQLTLGFSQQDPIEEW
jgi:hypothetical protein